MFLAPLLCGVPLLVAVVGTELVRQSVESEVGEVGLGPRSGMTCPSCRTKIWYSSVKGKSFACSSCGQRLTLPAWFYALVGVTSFLGAAAIGWWVAGTLELPPLASLGVATLATVGLFLPVAAAMQVVLLCVPPSPVKVNGDQGTSRSVTCPLCDASIRWEGVSTDEEFACPVCNSKLALSDRYRFWTSFGVPVFAAVAVSWAAGLSGLAIIVGATMLYLPAVIFLLPTARSWFPPKLEVRDFRPFKPGSGESLPIGPEGRNDVR